MTPEKIDRYEVRAEIGRGGMATVFRANDPRFDREVAIKVLPHEFLHDPQFRARFVREARAVASLEHSAIVPVYDYGENEGQPFIVMRLMSGGSLSERLRKGALSIKETGEILSRMAPALDAAHARGIIHRDLKPANILFDQYGNSFLSDFGIARVEASGATLTQTGVIGTPAYMSPEQIQGDQEIDGRSDVYALGIIVYQLLTGEMPYKADTPAKLMMAHLLNPVPDIREIRTDLPEPLSTVLRKALAKNRDQRFVTAGEFANAYQEATLGIMPTQITAEEADPNLATRVYQPPTPRPTPTGIPSIAPPAETRVGASPDQPAQVSTTNAEEAASESPILAPRGNFPLLVGGGMVGVIATVAIVVFAMLFFTQILPAMQAPAQTEPAVIATNTQEALPSPTNTLPPAPTDTPAATEAIIIVTEASPPPESTATNTPEPSATPPPALPVIGGADQIAFLNDNDVFLMNLDGSGLTQLTEDGAVKTNLQWTPDGNQIVYVSGRCIYGIEADTGRFDTWGCFQAVEFLEGFSISPDGTKAAISLDRQLYIFNLDREALAAVRFRSDLLPLADCPQLAPYTGNAVKYVKWSADGQKLAVTFIGADSGLQVDLIRVMDVSICTDKPARLDEFPASRFTIRGYNNNPVIQNFGWDGVVLFSLTGVERNGGYGQLYIYNTDLRRADLEVNPIDGVCCYRDPSWSPDGTHLAFAFQDIRQGSESTTALYIVPAGTLGTGLSYTPIPLPDGFFTNPRATVLPILRPVRP